MNYNSTGSWTGAGKAATDASLKALPNAMLTGGTFGYLGGYAGALARANNPLGFVSTGGSHAGAWDVETGAGHDGSGDSVYIPRDAEGNLIPLKKQVVNGQDIPLPDLAAEGRPHTVLGGTVSSKTGEIYRQSATFPGKTWPTAKGYDVPWSEVHWTDHGTPYHHANPHQHIFEYNSDKGGWIRKGPTVFEP